MSVTAIEIAGLVGVVLVVSTGKIFNPLREFLRSFTHRYNPACWIADLISCSMCAGVWIGGIWGIIHSWSWTSIVIFAGLLSLLSFVANEVLGLIGILTLRISGGIVGTQYRAKESAVVALADARVRNQGKMRRVAPGNVLTEEEADALLDKETEEADLMFAPLDAAGEGKVT
jgi:hypothetical protein